VNCSFTQPYLGHALECGTVSKSQYGIVVSLFQKMWSPMRLVVKQSWLFSFLKGSYLSIN